ncbi:RNA polymerase sigma factor [Paraglaciecola sp.]|uniref:RNA polymerase sigma factor n=1 Tax=Paraglaciecola sp. TaxID=1920173 RepID=UPI003EF5B80A
MINKAEEDLLVLAAQKGNQDAFRVLFQRHHKALLRFAYKLCQDQELAKEATQEAWIKSSKTIFKLKDPRAFKSWLYRLTRWRIIDLVRQVKTRDKLIESTAAYDDLPDGVDDIDVNIKQGNTDSLIQAIDTLPTTERHMIHLFYLDEMSVAEVSVVLEIPIGTVKSRLNRARHLLRQKYGSKENEY